MTLPQVTTTARTGGNLPGGKAFSWSYSKLKNYEACPKKHWHVDIQKDFKEDISEDLQWGNRLHKAAAEHLSKGEKLPDGMEVLVPWLDRVRGEKQGESKILVEQQLAITREFLPCPWFDSDARKVGLKPWFRGIADVLKISGPVALAMDWKTGKIKEDGVQLALMAACIFAHHPTVQKIRTEFIWLAHDASSRVDFSREDMPKMWQSIWHRIDQLERAHNNLEYPAKPGGLCRRWCPVTSCPHHGE